MSKLAKALTAAAGNAGGGALYVEDVFSTYLFVANGATGQTITNGIDLSTEGGMVWNKDREVTYQHVIWDTERGTDVVIRPDSTGANESHPSSITYNTNGYDVNTAQGNESTDDTVSWTFRKAEKFFDVVTYTGDDVSGREIAHNLGSTPAVIIVKKTSGTYNWQIYHSSLGATKFLEFNTGASQTSSAVWNDTAPTDAVFTVGNEYGVNQSGDTYVAYLFASDAGGFGDDGSENIIKCGSYTGTGSAGLEIDLGFEPQFLIVKKTNGVASWYMQDVMRGMQVSDYGGNLFANLSNAEAPNAWIYATATGFGFGDASVNYNGSGDTYIYIAIRRPMKTPESGTEVFNVEMGNGGGSSTVPEFSAPFASDLFYMQNRNGGGANYNGSRLAGNSYLLFESTNAEASGLLRWDSMNGMYFFSTTDYIGYMFKRATGFMDVVAFSGSSTLSERTYNHNLGVQPELIIIKGRSGSYGSGDWNVATNQGAKNEESINTTKNHTGFQLNATNGITWGTEQNWSDVCSTNTFTTDGAVSFITNSSGNTIQWSAGTDFIAYLFATLAGVSKVGSYTGTGADLNVDCGFSAGARFILIKRADSTGDWYVYDSVRGIVAGNDPYLLLNSAAAEVTGTDYIDPLSSGFTVTSSAPAALNASGGTYIFLAIAQVT